MKMVLSHDLVAGDIVFAVDGAEQDPLANTADLFIQLRKTPGESVTLDILRDGKRLRMPLTTHRIDFRK